MGFESDPFSGKILFPFSEPKWHFTEIKLGAISSAFDVESDGDLLFALQCPKSGLKSVFCFYKG